MEKINNRPSKEIIKDSIVEQYRTFNKFLTNDKFLNHGYYDPSTGYSNQENLYYHLVRNMDISNLDVLDIGCGHGGGLNLLYNKVGCKSVTGVDISPENIDFCKRTYEDSMSFFVGDAEDLQLQDEKFDIVFNVESAHCYPNYEKFLSEVVRVLRPGGLFLFTDTLSGVDADQSDIYLVRKFPGLEVVSEKDISQQVTDSCRVDVNNSSSWMIMQVAKEKIDGYLSGEIKHFSFIYRKVA
jgi:ubiquinone/menaquinone biosynthesis C-methylase UbiE